MRFSPSNSALQDAFVNVIAIEDTISNDDLYEADVCKATINAKAQGVGLIDIVELCWLNGALSSQSQLLEIHYLPYFLFVFRNPAACAALIYTDRERGTSDDFQCHRTNVTAGRGST